MISVLGFELETGKQALEKVGNEVIVKPCDDKSIIGADTNIIVRQKLLGENTVEILYGAFKTKADLTDD